MTHVKVISKHPVDYLLNPPLNIDCPFIALQSYLDTAGLSSSGFIHMLIGMCIKSDALHFKSFVGM